jgi:hypothetical protein
MQLTLGKTYLGANTFFLRNQSLYPNLWDQLGFLVTKILGGDYSIFHW